MIKGVFKNEIEKIEIFIGRMLSIIPLGPDSWTLLSLIFGLFGFILFIQKEIIGAIIIFLLSFILDVVDGSVAKYLKKQTFFGDYFDGVSDIVVDSLFVIGLWMAGLPTVTIGNYSIDASWVILLCLLGVFLTSFTKSHAAYSNVEWRRKLDSMYGLLQRGERCALFMFSAAVFLYEPGLASLILLATGILSIFTVIQRFHFVYSLD
jgi:phosphatidylglycerophosphate synthase